MFSRGLVLMDEMDCVYFVMLYIFSFPVCKICTATHVNTHFVTITLDYCHNVNQRKMLNCWIKLTKACIRMLEFSMNF